MCGCRNRGCVHRACFCSHHPIFVRLPSVPVSAVTTLCPCPRSPPLRSHSHVSRVLCSCSVFSLHACSQSSPSPSPLHLLVGGRNRGCVIRACFCSHHPFFVRIPSVPVSAVTTLCPFPRSPPSHSLSDEFRDPVALILVVAVQTSQRASSSGISFYSDLHKTSILNVGSHYAFRFSVSLGRPPRRCNRVTDVADPFG